MNDYEIVIEWLSRYLETKGLLNQIKEKFEELSESLTNIHAIDYSKIHVQKSGQNDRKERIMNKIEKLQCESLKLEEKKLDILGEMIDFFESVYSFDRYMNGEITDKQLIFSDILVYVFIAGKTCVEIAKIMGYTDGHTRRMKGQAIRDITPNIIEKLNGSEML